MPKTIDASGQTGHGSERKLLWDLNTSDNANTLFVQNRSGSVLTVAETPVSVGGQPPTKPILTDIPARGDFVLDASVIDLSSKLEIFCDKEGATFTAWRGINN